MEMIELMGSTLIGDDKVEDDNYDDDIVDCGKFDDDKVNDLTVSLHKYECAGPKKPKNYQD